jgi:anti-anti-sigma factor
MQIRLREVPEGVTVLTPEGRLNKTTAALFRERIAELVGSGTTQVIVDLNEVDFLDSSGLAAIIAGLKMVRQEGGNLCIARPNQQAQLVLERTSLSHVLPPFDNLGDAISAF